MRSRIADSSISRVREAGRCEHRLDDRAATPTVLDDARTEVGKVVLLGEGAHVVVDEHVVVVQVRHRAAAMTVQAVREGADDERLEVVHEVAPDQTRGVRDIRTEQQAWRLPRAGADDDRAGGDFVRVPVGVEIADAACRAGPSCRAGSARRSTPARISQRPVRNAFRNGATGSPFASIGQP